MRISIPYTPDLSEAELRHQVETANYLLPPQTFSRIVIRVKGTLLQTTGSSEQVSAIARQLYQQFLHQQPHLPGHTPIELLITLNADGLTQKLHTLKDQIPF